MEDYCCHTKHTPRDEKMVKNLKQRLNRIAGQLNGVSKMIDENRYCGDVLIQIAAIENALKEVGYIVLKDHMMTCVSDDIKNNDFSSLEEAIEITKKLK
ncbi:MAG: metal-sensing transcriptional repressor [Bacilli bacterium]|nr:metal-sensing transcriptional repressor [Bacilli bacterium]